MSRLGALRRVSLLAAVAFGGCGTLGPGDGPATELERARAMWEAVAPANYTYVIRHLCFCPPQTTGPVRVRVAGATVTARVYVDSDEPVEEQLAEYFPSVVGLFEFIEDAIDRGAATVEVTYHPDTGIPLEVWVDYQQNVADEERGYAVVQTPVPDPTP